MLPLCAACQSQTTESSHEAPAAAQEPPPEGESETNVDSAPRESEVSSKESDLTKDADSPYGPVEFSKLTDGVWVHTSYKSLPDIGPFPSNGLIVETAEGPLLIDTAWNDAQTEQIFAWAQDELGQPIAHLVVTHAHDDKMGGVHALNERGVATHGLRLTNEAAKTRDLVPTTAAFDLEEGQSTTIAGVEVFYPGGGHTEDNVVVYVASSQVLFGGCLIRPGPSGSLGNTADANIDHWDVAVEHLVERYPDAQHVIPSHGPPGGPELLEHTITLVREHREKQKTP